MASDERLLARAERWFRSAMDGADGVHWLNGESEKYSGEAWQHAIALHRALCKRLGVSAGKIPRWGKIADRPTAAVAHLNQSELARRWSMSPRTLERWRWHGEGPSFLKVGGHVVYRADDVAAYEAGRCRRVTPRTRRRRKNKRAER